MKISVKARYNTYLGILCLMGIGVWAMTYMPGTSYKGFPPATDKQTALSEQMKQEVIELASTPHNSTHIPALIKAQGFMEQQLKSRGFTDIHVQSYGDPNGFVFKNYEVVIEPKEEALKTVVIGAHYDSAWDAPGADDNASSVTILLELASRFKESFNSLHTRLRIVFFTNEEPPFFRSRLMGSVQYAKMLHDMKEPVEAMYAFDALGYYKEEKGTQHYPFMFKPFYPNTGNFVGFVGNWDSRSLVVKSVVAFRKEAQFPSEGVSAWSRIPGIDFSDHQSFYQYGWKALMVTDTAFNRNETYHKSTDTPEKLDYIKMAQLTDELEKMFKTLYQPS